MLRTTEQCEIKLISYTYAPPETLTDVDYLPCSAARVSFGNEDKTGASPEKDKQLMTYLANHQHLSPFEHQSATFLIECPLFIRSQIMRHRTFSYNEISRRYTEEDLKFWMPDKFRKQSKSNRQASTDDGVDDLNFCLKEYKTVLDTSLAMYHSLLDQGVCREQARAVLPQCTLTKFYMTGNLRNWAHFVNLRKDPHAQQEVQHVANVISNSLEDLWPTAWGVLVTDA